MALSIVARIHLFVILGRQRYGAVYRFVQLVAIKDEKCRTALISNWP
jgi:hypothetical protein